jgi:hypothetical protein
MHFQSQSLLTSIRLGQVEKASARVGGILHDFLNLFFGQNSILDSIVRFNNDNSYTSNSQKVSNLQCMWRRRVFAISQQSTRSRVSRECFWRRYYPKVFGMRGNQQLTRSRI